MEVLSKETLLCLVKAVYFLNVLLCDFGNQKDILPMALFLLDSNQFKSLVRGFCSVGKNSFRIELAWSSV